MEENTKVEENSAEDSVQLGGNIVLSGFRDIDGGSKVILRKIVGSYARKFADSTSNFEKLALSMKLVHQTEGSQKYEIKGKMVDNGQVFASDITDRNLFVAIDGVLKKLESSFK